MDVYQQADIIEPAGSQTAGNARHAIRHLGRMLVLAVYPAADAVWQVGDADATDDGRHYRGDPVMLDIRGVFQPNTQKRGRGVVDDVEGARSEVSFILHVDSHDPVNIEATSARPDIFPNGLRLYDVDAEGEDGGSNYPMILHFRGDKFKLRQPIALYSGGDPLLDTDGAIYRAECSLWRDKHHERPATPTENVPAWGPA